MKTFQAIYADGAKATVRDDDATHAFARLAQAGRGTLIVEMKEVGAKEFRIFDNTTDDDYTEGE